MKYPIPKQSAEALPRIGKSTNPGLLFDRFTPALALAHNKEEETKWKKEGFNNVIAHRADKDALDHYQARWNLVIAQTGATSFKMKTDWRFIAGLGRKGALEVGFTFHRYGFPMLPGSSVKGIARAVAFYEIAEKLGLEGKALSKLDEALSEGDAKKYAERMNEIPRADEVKELARNFRLVFGTTEQAGKAIFFDAIPQKPPKLELDIINPHYPDYYGDKENKVYPTNWQSPIPSYFLTVAPGQEFLFAVGWRGKPDADAHKAARDWLEKGLKELGAGAKTSAGYGYWNEVKAEEKK
jgi:CRISPR-associated protein Cmr6